MSTPSAPPTSTGRQATKLGLVVGAFGVVFGDIGTSPLYALRECFSPAHGIATRPEEVTGVVSLVVWAITLIVCLKYLLIVVRADNHGEGGILALVSLVGSTLSAKASGKSKSKAVALITTLGIIGAALLYSDGILTPSISVLSAVEGLRVINPGFESAVVPIALGILLALFFVQSRGTAKVGRVFGPVLMVWFGVIGVLGAAAVTAHPGILAALNPWSAISFVGRHGLAALGILGSVFLAVTGAEVMYADMGHFGRSPIRRAWFSLVYPALILNYLGQGALVLTNPETIRDPFFHLAPTWFQYPLVAIATMATIIASQAVISGAFSLARQSVQLGFWPRLQIRHTSAETIGQVYVPFVNWALMVGTIALVLGFQHSDRLANAYGIAVSADMLITTCLITVIALRLWKASWFLVGGVLAVFLVIDGFFFAANASKLISGGWIVVLFAAVLFILMRVWMTGRARLRDKLAKSALSLTDFVKSIQLDPPLKTAGTAIFLSGNPSSVPLALLQNLKHNRVLHEQTIVVVVETKTISRVRDEERLQITDLAPGFYQIKLQYGFSETPNIPQILESKKTHGLRINPMHVTYFLGREILIFGPPSKNGLVNLRRKLFWFLSHNALNAADFFKLPPERVIEVGARTEI